MFFRAATWSPCELDWLKANREERSINEISLYLAKSRNAVKNKLLELDGKYNPIKKNKISRIGKRDDILKDGKPQFFRSSWEANLARLLIRQKKEWTYEPQVFIFEAIKHGTVSYCLTGDTPVLTLKGYLPIKDISVGDRVYAPTSGKQRLVTHLFNREVNENLWSLKTKADVSPPKYLTKEHPVLAYKANCKQKYCNYKYHRPDRCALNKDIKNDIKWYPISMLSQGDFIAVPLGTYDYLSNFNEDLAWISGLYLAEGSRGSCQRAIITLGKQEKELALKVKNIVANHGFNSRIEEHKSTIQIHIHDHFYEKVISLFVEGESSTTKRISEKAMNCSLSLQSKFLEGYLTGDGTENKQCFRISTSSEMLAHQIFLLVARQGFYPSKTWGRGNRIRFIEGRKVNCHQEFTVQWYKSKTSNISFLYENYYLFPISELKEVHFKGKVYNIEVETDNCYFIHSIPSHNCPDFKQDDLWIEIKGMLDGNSATAIRRFKKFYPEEFKKLRAVVGRPNTKADKFFKKLEVPILYYMNELDKEYKEKIAGWE